VSSTIAKLERRIGHRRGQTAVEYALLLALFGLAAVIAVGVLGQRARTAVDRVAMALQVQDAPEPAPGAAPPASGVHVESVASPAKPPHVQPPVLYKMKQNATDEQLGQFKALVGKYDLREEKKVVKGRVSRGKAMGQEAPDAEALCAELRGTGAVDFAEPDRLIPPGRVPNDPSYPSQWLHTTIGSPRAWDVTTGSRSVIVAVCDTGVQSNHPDLAPNLKLPGFNSVDGTTNTEPVMWHGTSVAGCIGAVGNNGAGVSGINWTVSILPVRISNTPDGCAYYSDMAEGISWAADAGARVVNLSYAGWGSATVDSAAQYLLGKGGLLFIAAGNNGQDTSTICPPSPDYVVVGATTSSDALASWSNYGAGIDVVAPGEGIYTTYTGSGYASVNGTSFASPIAAGVAALVFAKNPALTPLQVAKVLYSTCTDLGAEGPDSKFGNGRVNAAAAVAAAAAAPPGAPPVAQASASPDSGQAPLAITFDGRASTDSDGSIVSYAWDFGDGSSAQGAMVTHTYASAGTFTPKLTVTDNGGATASAMVSVTLITTDLPPTARAFASPTSGTAPLDVSFDGSGSSDSDGSIVSYAWDFGDGSSAQGATVTHTYASVGTFTPKLTVTDNGGATASATVTVTVTSRPSRPVHVGGITVSTSRRRHGVQATAAVLVLDAGGAPVPGAAVSATWSGVATGSDSARTRHDGVSTIKSKKISTSGTATFTVTRISGNGLSYDPAQNAQTSASILAAAQ